MKIMEDHDAVLVVPDETTPEDIDSGKAKVLGVFQQWWDAEKWVKEQEERWAR